MQNYLKNKPELITNLLSEITSLKNKIEELNIKLSTLEGKKLNLVMKNVRTIYLMK